LCSGGHTRHALQEELLAIWKRERTTVLFVTHGTDEAGSLPSASPWRL
jgi:ABC-type nitrate/sulfonate/bicarbonate transport system ATPase subunit